MADPLSWQTILYVEERVRGIKQVDGYHSDLGLAPIYLDRTQHVESKGDSVLIVAGTFDTTTEGSTKKTLSSDMAILVEYAVVAAPGVNPELIAHQGRADLIRVFQQDLFASPLGLRSLDVASAVITGATAAGSDLVIAQVVLRAGLSETRNPAT